MTLLEFAKSRTRRLSIVIGCRPGVKLAGYDDKTVMEDVDRKVSSVLAFAERFDPDVVFSISGMASEAESLGAVVENKETGSQAVVVKPLGSCDDTSLLEKRPIRDSRLCSIFLDSLRLLSERVTDRPVAGSIAGPLSVSGQLIGLDRMLVLSVEKPGFLRSVLEIVTERVIEYMEMQVQCGAGFINVAEPSGSLLSPAAFRELCLPYLKALFARIRVPYFLHICGNTNRHIDVLAETGAQGISVDAMVDMRMASRILGPETAICGNISASGALLQGTPEEVRRTTAEMLESMSGAQNYIPASSCSIGRDAPHANLDAFFGEVRR
jgi:MtaA/CmuA family methyltransferase